MKNLASTSLLMLSIIFSLNAGFTREYTQNYSVTPLDIHVNARVLMDDIEKKATTEVSITGNHISLLGNDTLAYVYFLDGEGYSCGVDVIHLNQDTHSPESLHFSCETSYKSMTNFPGVVSSISVSIPDLLRITEIMAHEEALPEHEKIEMLPPFLLGIWDIEGTKTIFTEDSIRFNMYEASIKQKTHRYDDVFVIYDFYSEKNILLAKIKYDLQTNDFAFIRTDDENIVDIYIDGHFLTNMRRSDV